MQNTHITIFGSFVLPNFQTAKQRYNTRLRTNAIYAGRNITLEYCS